MAVIPKVLNKSSRKLLFPEIPVGPTSTYVRIRPINWYGYYMSLSKISFYNSDSGANLYIPNTAFSQNWENPENAFDDNSGTLTIFSVETALLEQWIGGQITGGLSAIGSDLLGLTNNEYNAPPQAGWVDISPDGVNWTTLAYWFETPGVGWPSSYEQLFVLHEVGYEQRVWGIEIFESNDPNQVRVGDLNFTGYAGGPLLCEGGYGWGNSCPPSSDFPADAFDIHANYFWRPGISGVNTGKLFYFFPWAVNPSCVVLTAADAGGGAMAPRAFRVGYTYDGLTWTYVHEVTDQIDWADGETRSWCWVE